MMRIFLALCALGLLVACGGAQQGPLPAEQLQSVAVRADGPPKLTLVTMINNRNGQGAHSALMISGSQRVIFDPAGSYRHEYIAEYGDVLYGITDLEFRRYRSAHARSTFHVVSQEIEVSAEVAELALQLAQASGTVPGAFCTNATSGLLRQLPGFGDISSTFFPANLMRQLEGRPGVVTDAYYENDDGDIVDGVAAARAQAAASSE